MATPLDSIELSRIFAGEAVSFDINCDTSTTNEDYTLAGAITFQLGPEGADPVDDTATVTIVAGDGVADSARVTYASVPILPDGIYPWQLVTTGGALLAFGTIPVGVLIGTEAALDDTAIVVGTDTYLSVADADDLLAKRLNVDAWRIASADERARALCTATSDIDGLRLTGRPATSTQTLAFPRDLPVRTTVYTPYYDPTDDDVTQSSVPAAVLLAVALEAAAALDDPEFTRAKLQSQGVTSASYGSGSETFGRKAKLRSREAYAKIRPWLMGSGPIR